MPLVHMLSRGNQNEPFFFFFFFSLPRVPALCFSLVRLSFVLIFRQFSSSFPLLQSMTPSHCFELDMQTPGVHSNWSFPQAARIVYIRSDRMKKLSQGLFLSFPSSQFPSSNGQTMTAHELKKLHEGEQRSYEDEHTKYIYIYMYQKRGTVENTYCHE